MITGSSRVEHDRRFKISRPHARGQSLVEFALVLPILLVLFGGAVQFGVFFAAQNSLTQVVRDAGRWAATQQYGGSIPSTNGCTGNEAGVIAKANTIAANSSLLGYTSPWTSSNVTVAWTDATSGKPAIDACPPPDNSQVWFVTIRVTHDVPVVLPGLQYLPSIGTCDSSGCHLRLTSTSTFRMEPPPQ